MVKQRLTIPYSTRINARNLLFPSTNYPLFQYDCSPQIDSENGPRNGVKRRSSSSVVNKLLFHSTFFSPLSHHPCTNMLLALLTLLQAGEVGCSGPFFGVFEERSREVV